MKWEDVKKDISSLSVEEKIYLELLAEIVSAREEQGFTQREIADLTGLKQPAIARLESPTGQNAPNLLTVIKYLDAIGMKFVIRPKGEG